MTSTWKVLNVTVSLGWITTFPSEKATPLSARGIHFQLQGF